MIELAKSVIDHVLPWMLSGAGLAMPAVSAASIGVATIFGGWKKWVVILLAFGALAFWILALKLTIARQETTIATLSANYQTCKDVNRRNEAEVDQIRLDATRKVTALSATINRLETMKPKVRVIKEVIHEKAKECVGVNPADAAVVRWLRDNPEGSRDGIQIRPAEGAARAPEVPRRPATRQ